jgi:hypothetical protein
MTATPIKLTEKQLAEIAYEEACRVTAAFQTQHRIRKYATYLDPNERERLVNESEVQLLAAERREYAAWTQLEYLLKMAIKQPWASA